MAELLILGNAVGKRHLCFPCGCEDCGCRVTGYRHVRACGNAIQFITFRIPFPDRIGSSRDPGKNGAAGGGAVYQRDAFIPGMGRSVYVCSGDLKKECRVSKRFVPFIDLFPDRDLYLFGRVITGQCLCGRTVRFIDRETDLVPADAVSGRRLCLFEVVAAPLQIRHRDGTVSIGGQAFFYQASVVLIQVKLCIRKFPGLCRFIHLG